MADKTFIDRPPRIEPSLPSGVNDIPGPPDNDKDGAGSLMQQAFLPMVMIFGYVLTSTFGGGRNMLMMIPMLLSVVATIVLAFYTYLQEKKKGEAAEAAYKRAISELRRKMESEHEEQRIYYFYNYPDPGKTLGIAADLSRAPAAHQEDIRSGTRLWERRPKDHDFMYLRLGISTRESSVIYKISKNDKTENPLSREATRLAEDSRLLFNVPVTIPVLLPSDDTEKKKVEKKKADNEEEDKKEESQEAKGITPRHSIGIVGPSEEKVYAYIQTMLIDYAAYQSPQDSMLYVAGSGEARQHWRWAYALPHCKEADQTETLMFENEEKPGDNEVDRMRLYWKNLRTTLERRRMRLADKESGTDVKLPFLLLVVDVRVPAPAWSSLADLESEATISTILMDGQLLGAAVLFLVSSRARVPSRASAVIEVEPDPAEPGQAIFRYAETGFNSVRYLGHTRLVPNQEAAREFSRCLEPVDMRRGFGASLAATVTLMEMLNVHSIDALQALARENWRRSMDPKSADWLYTAVGLLSGNEPRVLTFSAKADGVHGIIAGSTGSGKSELLMTLIIGLALNFSPDVCNFVLVDYKGGSAFEPFKKLPHKVDIVTNLDQSATARVFASIIAELDRRQKLNTYTNSKDIVHYRRKGLNLDPERPPYPHLFIIIDEFAEMISARAEYKAQLESITRLGRALGVTLILAAQRPVGVTDQMRANIKFRISLRVETPDDSREVLRRSDAAFLPPGIPGRGYLQIGNENIELIQTAYTGGDYKGPQEENIAQNVIWLDRPRKSAGLKSAEPPKLYDVIVDMLASTALEESRPQWRPWPAFLPQQVGANMLTLQTPLDTAYMGEEDIELLRAGDDEVIPVSAREERTGGLSLNERAGSLWEDGFKWEGINWGKNAMSPLIGLVDNPYRASQKPLKVNFPGGHVVIFGASGRGKTTFLRTIITSLVLTHSPDELHIYILDFGGRAMMMLRDLPHVGAVIASEEDERVMRVLRRVNDFVNTRQLLFSEARVNSLDSYNLAHPEKKLPAVLVVMDNFSEFKEYYENLMSPLISLIRESRAYGVHFLISADLPNALTGKLYNLITERYTLKLSDASEYADIVGRGVPADIGMTPGRGYVRVGNMPLEFQTAVSFAPTEEDPEGLAHISKMCLRMQELWGNQWQGQKPSSIETLPLRVSLETLLAETAVPEVRRINAIVGIDDRTLAPASIDLERQGPHLVILGQPLSGKTTTLRGMILSIAHNYSPDEVMLVLIDYSRKLWKGSETSLADLPQVVQTIDDIEQLDGFLASFSAECADFETHPKRRKIMLFIDNYDAFTDESNRKKMAFFENMSSLIRKYQTSGVFLVVAGSLGIASAADDLRKVFMAPNFGLGLKSAEAVNRLNGKFPRSLAEAELPMGRAFTVRSGITSMLQLATPYADDDVEGSLDIWVRRIQQRDPGPKGRWLAEAAAQPAPEAAAAPAAPAPTQPKYDISALKAKLIEIGLPDTMVNLMSNADVVENARALGMLDEKKE